MATDVVAPPPGFELESGPPAPPDGFELDQPRAAPNMAAGNKTFSRTVGKALTAAQKATQETAEGAATTVGDIGSVYAPIEAALNAGTGLLFGFPAYVGGGLGGLVGKYLLGNGADPKELAETMQKVFTYQPQTERGARLAGNVMLPLQKLQEGSQFVGEKTTDLAMKAGAGDDTAAALGAVTDSTLQMLGPVLFGELARKMGGQTVGADDMKNAAKVVAGPEATPGQVAAAESSLHSTYEKTGIGPYTVMEEARRDPSVAADLVDPAVNVPKAFEQYIEKEPEPSKPVPGDGEPLLDFADDQSSRPLPETAVIADQLRSLGQGAGWAVEGGKMLRAPLEEGEGVQGKVTGRTPWIPGEQWFAAMRSELGRAGLSKPADIQAAIEKAVAGEKLKPVEQRTVDWMRAEVQRTNDALFHLDDNEIGGDALAAGLSSHDAGAIDLAAQAAEINPEAVERAAIAHENDDAAFLAEMQRIVGEATAKDTSAGAGASGARARQPSAAESGAGEPDAGSVGRDQPSSATYREGAGTLNAGLNAAAVLSAARDGYSNYVGVEADHVKPPKVDSRGQPVSRFADDLRRVLAPASRGEIASEQAGIMRANFGEMAHENVVAETRLFDYAKTFDKMPVAENVKFIDAYEHGTELTDPKLNAAAKALKDMNDGLREQIQDLGKGQLENFDENYLGRIWKDPESASRDLYSLNSRRPLEGNKNFLKARTIPYYVDGLQWRAYDAEGDFVKSFPTETEAKMAAGTEGRVGAPLEPITTNPVEMALLKGKEMRKYVYGQKIFQEMKDADLARFVAFGDRALPGWTKIDDKIARVLQPNEGEGGGMILRGEYYAPDEAATLINNHLRPSALQGNSFFEAWRMAGNMVNALQLGLSFFHVGFTSMDAIISKAALGMKQISRGDVLEGAANVGMAMTGPVQSINNLLKGDRLLRAYNGGLDAPELSPLVQAIQEAGGRVKIDDFYRNESVNAFRQALRNEQYGAAAKAFLPTVLDRISAPIFEWLVPRQKLGVFADMANDWIKQNPDAGLTERRAGLGKLWDSVDNRMGQLVYDNVFWNRTLKDSLMATVRSVGWNLGTFRELGGGLLDIKDIARDKGFSDRTAYVVALPALAAVYGSVLHYLYNGEPPEDLKDAFYPRTGRTRPDGSPDRVSLPTYMKDVFAYGEDIHNFVKYGGDPLQTLKNKAHPLISTVSQMLNNQDYFGGAIRNPADPVTQQIIDEAAYLVQQFEPFSMRNYMQQAKEKGEEPTMLGYLTSPSMIGITPAPGYMTKSDEQLESAQVNRMREPLIQKYREALKNGAKVEDVIPEMIKGGLSKRDMQYVIKSSGDTPKPSRLKKFGSDTESQ